MKKKKYILGIVFVCVLSLAFYACRKDPAETDANPVVYNPDWTEATHGNGAPDYATVFPQNEVNRIDIVIGTQGWNSIGNNMQSLFGIPFGALTTNADTVSNAETAYVSSSINFNGKQWKNVGFRLKGNKGLFYAWNKGIYKLPFRLNFDKFEDQYPGIKNQHFFGFEELSFAPGYKDPSLIREKLASDMFTLAGVASPQSAFYRVFVDIGTGPEYWGLYCMLELPEDNLPLSQLGENTGNIYKPLSRLNFFDSHDFEKKNNYAANDFSDASQLVQSLNSPLRITNYPQWKTNLSQQLDTDAFLRWLAVSNAMVNGNGYGNNDENYYLYHHSAKGFIWIPWDNNEICNSQPGIVGVPGGGQNGLSLSMNEITANWPLIRYLIDDSNYLQDYKNKLRTFLNEALLSGVADQKIDAYHTLIAPYVTGNEGEQPGYTYLNNAAEFAAAKNYLHAHMQSRKNLINQYLQ